MMEAGEDAEFVLQKLLAADPEKAIRQVGLVDRNGGSATFTGENCYDWAGGLAGSGFAVQGNILKNDQVVPAMGQTFLETRGPLAWRLFQALLAGDRAGGDRRGRQSAALLVVKPSGGYGGFNDRWFDLRVDDHSDPIQKLGELVRLHELYFGDSPEQEKLTLGGDVLRNLQAILRITGYYQGPLDGELNPETSSGLETFIGNENFEERVDIQARRIDRPVYEYILEHFGAQK